MLYVWEQLLRHKNWGRGSELHRRPQAYETRHRLSDCTPTYWSPRSESNARQQLYKSHGPPWARAHMWMLSILWSASSRKYLLITWFSGQEFYYVWVQTFTSVGLDGPRELASEFCLALRLPLAAFRFGSPAGSPSRLCRPRSPALACAVALPWR